MARYAGWGLGILALVLGVVAHGSAAESRSSGVMGGDRPWIVVPTMRVEDLAERLGEEGLVVIDVTCRERRSRLSGQIPGAVWRDCTRVEEWAPEFRKDQLLVVYCA
ncbi:rhodanese-like domain-containing protein [Deferrisoma palaeochoriense]